ncbi:uncharacterized protein LOC142322800 isoform X2 [Lycorma delicatula]|uniref:uncharacterized protein LOC142322800 isoform X2 n=1 Tax=Lycorma delicatula TaxID=130591 RepID=UPI003F50FD74
MMDSSDTLVPIFIDVKTEPEQNKSEETMRLFLPHFPSEDDAMYKHDIDSAHVKENPLDSCYGGFPADPLKIEGTNLINLEDIKIKNEPDDFISHSSPSEGDSLHFENDDVSSATTGYVQIESVKVEEFPIKQEPEMDDSVVDDAPLRLKFEEEIEYSVLQRVKVENAPISCNVTDIKTIQENRMENCATCKKQMKNLVYDGIMKTKCDDCCDSSLSESNLIILKMDSEIILYDEVLLDSEYYQMINNNGQLEQLHVATFNSILEKRTRYKFQGIRSWENPESITAVRKDLDYIQIIYLPGHYVCCYYDAQNIYIYDSLNVGRLTVEMSIFLEKLFPYQNLTLVKFPAVQKLPNFIDCGVYAIAFAVSLVFGIKPNKIRYDHGAMRNHLIKILKTTSIEHFPQDPRFPSCKVLPLNVALCRRYKAIAKRVKSAFDKIAKKNKSKPKKSKRKTRTVRKKI